MISALASSNWDEKPRLKMLTGSAHQARAKIAIDIDSTLYDFPTAAREAFQKLYEESGNSDYQKGLYHSWDEWRSPADICGLETWMQVISMCHRPEVIERQAPFPGAVATLQALADQGYTLMYVSTRNPESAEATYNWLRGCDFPMGRETEIHCRMEPKKPYLSECQYLIDDRPRTLVEFVYDFDWSRFRGEREAFSLLMPYNRALTDIPNIYLAPTWAGISAFLVKRGLLPTPSCQPLEV